MDEQPRRRRHRLPDGLETRAVKKSIAFPGNMFTAIEQAAREEGHDNISRIVQTAVAAYLNRRYDVRAA